MFVYFKMNNNEFPTAFYSFMFPIDPTDLANGEAVINSGATRVCAVARRAYIILEHTLYLSVIK